EMKARRAELSAKVGELAALEAGGTALNTEQLASIDAMQKEFDELGAKINRAEQAERMAAATATQVETLKAQGAPPAASEKPAAQPRADVETRPHALGRLVAALGNFKGMHPAAAAPFAAEQYGEDIGAVLANSAASGGNVLVPQNLSAEIIELLTPLAVVRQLGAESLPLPKGGNITLGRNIEGVVGSYVTQVGDKDTDRIQTDAPKYDSAELKARTFAGLIPVNNDFLRNAQNGAMLALIEGDTSRGLASQEDAQFIRGSDAGGKAPKGLLNWALAGNKIPAAAATGTAVEILAKVDQDLSKLILALEGANSLLRKAGWIMAPRTKRFLMSLRDGNGNKAYPEMDQGLLKGYPFRSTTNVPVNLVNGASTCESEIYFADFGDCYIGEDGAIEFAVATEASYVDADGNVRHAFQENQTLVRAILRHDFAPRHVENVAVLTNVTWGK
ncbi:MAG TPA: phage major capsid protein, partial [Azonexus sp.]|nr:phage major capsid protein [Azonexus sp.]